MPRHATCMKQFLLFKGDTRRRWGNDSRFNGFYGAAASIHRNEIDGNNIWAFWEHPFLFCHQMIIPGSEVFHVGFMENGTLRQDIYYSWRKSGEDKARYWITKSTIAITVNLFLIQTWKESPFLEDGQKLEHGADGWKLHILCRM